MENYVILRKCAYLFHWTASTYFYGTAEQYERKQQIRKFFESYYYNPEKLAEKIPYTRDENNNVIIDVLGKPEILNDMQIEYISNDPENIINNRLVIDVEKIAKDTPNFHRFCRNDLHSNNYRTMQFEFFTGAADLGYIRVHFKNNYECFIVDKRTREFYTKGERGHHKPITSREIRRYLGIESDKAENAFYEVIQAIKDYKTEV